MKLAFFMAPSRPHTLASAAGRIAGNFSGNGAMTVDPSSQERLRFWSEAWRVIQDAPWFGHGLNSFGTLAKENGNGIMVDIVTGAGETLLPPVAEAVKFRPAAP